MDGPKRIILSAARGRKGSEPVRRTGASRGWRRALGEFFSELKIVLRKEALVKVLLKVRQNDLFGLAGQLAYSFLISFFPFLIFIVALIGLAWRAEEPDSPAARSIIGHARGVWQDSAR